MKSMSLKPFLMSAAVCTVAVFSCGIEKCTSEDMEEVLDPAMYEESLKPPHGAISIHSIVKYPRAEQLEVKIPSYFGNEVCINKNQLLDEANIEKITAVPIPGDPGFYHLKLKLTGRGRKLWIGLSVPNKNTKLALVIDGVFYRGFTPRMIYDDVTEEVIIDGPIDQATALDIQNNSAKNHRKMNK